MESSTARRGMRKESIKGPNIGKLPVAEPQSPKKFFIAFVMFIFRKILLGVGTTTKLAIYLAVVTVISFLTDISPLPQSYFSDKRNFINQYFVKWCWAWTLIVLGRFIYVTSNVYCCGNKERVKWHLGRLLVGTFWWYTFTSLFDYIRQSTGVCLTKETEILDMRSCTKAGFGWTGTDISGHTFMMVFCLLCISEEAQVIRGWASIKDVIKKEEQHRTSRMSDAEFSELKYLYNDPVPYRLAVIFLAILQIVWEIMLLSTVLYFHDMPTKLGGALSATFVWFVSYRGLFHIGDILPPRPGKGLFNFLK